MSNDNSSSLNLRVFRIQKKPVLTHKSLSNGSYASNSGYTSVHNGTPNSDVDGDLEDITPPQQKTTKEAVSPQSTMTTKHAVAQATPAQINTAYPNGITLNTRPPKSAKVIEKERQMKYLLENFPKVDAMVIHNVLSRHGFNTELAAEELSKNHEKQMKVGEYEKWVKDQEKVEEQKVAETAAINAASRAKYYETLKRKTPPTFIVVGKKKAKKRRMDDNDTDDSDHGDFKDTRVFDSDEDSDIEISDELTTDKRNVLEFLQKATPNELQLMSSCSKKKVEAIIELRPFKGWIDLVEKLQSNKNLSTDLLNAAQRVLTTRNNIKHLMKKCTNLAQQMERAVAAGAGVKQQPRSITTGLRLTSYQMVGLNWLAVLHAQCVNGILADEMGLGKTVQVIAFLAHLKEIKEAKSVHLVVVPSSTLDNWSNEFQRWCPNLKVLLYYGSVDERKQIRIDWSKGYYAGHDVILTTYSMVANTSEERRMFRITPMHYVIFDEAHMLKNMNTQRYENLIRINAANRILLTGTPLQNNLLELMSLLIFVMPKMFAEKTEDLKSLFQKNSKSKHGDDDIPTFEKDQVEQAKRIMKPFVLRRLKRDVLQDLPKKSDTIVNVPLAPTQREQYENLVNTFQNVSKQDPNYNSYNGVTMMSDLRKLSNHPLLLRYHYQYSDLPEIAKMLAADPGYKDTKEEYIIDDLACMSDFEIHTMTKQYSSIRQFALPDNLITTSGKFLYLNKKLTQLKEEGHRVLIFSQYVILLNVLEEFLKIKEHSYLRLDGSTPVNTRQHLIDEFTQDESIFIFLLSTKAGGLGVNLTAADTVIIHDIDFNPYNDKQAEDRCHRMGQTKPVDVYRLIAQGTIEEGMLQMNKEKLKLERDITTDEGDSPDVKSVVRLLSSVLGIDNTKATNLVSPPKKKS